VFEWTTIIRRPIAWNDLEREQETLLAQVRENPDRAYLLISEPSPTFTSGLSADAGELLWNSEELAARGAQAVRIARGGKWTFHGPGQIVLYPLVKLDRLGYDFRAAHRFLNELRGSVVDYLLELNVETTISDDPFGVFHGPEKLVSFGIGIRRGVISNGLALYYDDQSRYFQGIHPCGVPGARTTHLTALGVSRSWEEVALGLAERVKKGFKSSKN
jgi:lipoyl(octanoyl) transferase